MPKLLKSKSPSLRLVALTPHGGYVQNLGQPPLKENKIFLLPMSQETLSFYVNESKYILNILPSA